MLSLLQVSRLQVAELITAAVINPDLATNKCLELVAETTAPERSLTDLLEILPTEITKEEQEQLAEIEAEARKELEAAQAQLAEANEVLAVSADKVAQLSDALKEAKANEKEVRGEASGILREGAQAQKALEAAEAAAEKAVSSSCCSRQQARALQRGPTHVMYRKKHSCVPCGTMIGNMVLISCLNEISPTALALLCVSMFMHAFDSTPMLLFCNTLHL